MWEAWLGLGKNHDNASVVLMDINRQRFSGKFKYS